MAPRAGRLIALRRTLVRARLQPRSLTARFRPLPAFVIVGAQRCGTTSLYNYLAAHPAVAPPIAKELQYFSDNFAKGERWYRSHFPARRDAVAFEATPYYLFHPLAAERAASVIPDARIVAVVRNPVDRAFSHYRHSAERGHEALSFPDALEAEPERLAGEAERIVADPGYRSEAHRVFSYASRGRYAEQLERWISRYGADRVLVVRSEDLYADPASVYADVIRFLGLPSGGSPSFRVHAAAPRHGDMPIEVRARLVDEFRPHNARLESLLGRPMSWDA